MDAQLLSVWVQTSACRPFLLGVKLSKSYRHWRAVINPSGRRHVSNASQLHGANQVIEQKLFNEVLSSRGHYLGGKPSILHLL